MLRASVDCGCFQVMVDLMPRSEMGSEAAIIVESMAASADGEM